MRRCLCAILLALFSLLLGACDGGPGGRNAVDPLPAVVDEIVFLPDRARLVRALHEEVDAQTVDAILAENAGFRNNPLWLTAPKPGFVYENDPDNLKKLMTPFARGFGDPDDLEVRVFSATTEQIIACEKGTAAYTVFPNGARRVAEQILRPGVTFYEVVYWDKQHGWHTAKVHLFFWDGDQWSMLGSAWRVLPD